jgi:hypothetical protein
MVLTYAETRASTSTATIPGIPDLEALCLHVTIGAVSKAVPFVKDSSPLSTS